MDKEKIAGYADYLLKAAIYRCDSLDDAEELTQETLMAALIASEQGRVIENPKSWLLGVLNRKYYDKLRQKYRKPTVSMDIIAEMPADSAAYERIEKQSDAENIRRCLTNLTRIYRETMIRFYMRGESIKQISSALGIPENTVKSRLDTGRRHIRKDFNMESYTKQSYEPEVLWVCSSGESGLNGEPFSLIKDDKITMNLLILAYNKPVTLPELANAIGISTVYIEPVVERLIKCELMKKTGDKVYTDFIIFDEADRTKNSRLKASLPTSCIKTSGR